MGVLLAILLIAALLLVMGVINKGVDRLFRPADRRIKRRAAADRLERQRRRADGDG